MSNDLTKLYETQISLTEWFEKMNHQDFLALRIEDYEKRERLKVLNSTIGLPFDKPYQFSAEVVASRTFEFQEFLQEHGNELCALRLIPLDSSLPKLRTRGASINDSLVWFAEQNMDLSRYRADFTPHTIDNIWSTIFIINQNGVYGEIIKGSHNQLTQGFYDEGEPIAFAYENFTNWRLSPANQEAESYLQEMIQLIHVADEAKRSQLSQELQTTFAKNYICGYFETVASSQFGTWFIDYNRILGKIYENFVTPINNLAESENILTGKVGSPGKAAGKVKIINSENFNDFEEGNVLVCAMTSPDYLPLMQKSVAIITDLGGILSHAAIVARELGKPCVVGVKNATKVLHDGDLIEVNANNGVVRIIKK